MIAAAAAWTAGCAALAAFLAWTGLPVWLAILAAWTGPAAAAGVLLWAYGEISERRQPDGVPGAQPVADLAFLANCLWCADLSEEPLDCTCTDGCPEVEWCVARYERTNTAIGTIPPYREETPR